VLAVAVNSEGESVELWVYVWARTQRSPREGLAGLPRTKGGVQERPALFRLYMTVVYQAIRLPEVPLDVGGIQFGQHQPLARFLVSRRW
jgi:hypothetical protein